MFSTQLLRFQVHIFWWAWVNVVYRISQFILKNPRFVRVQTDRARVSAHVTSEKLRHSVKPIKRIISVDTTVARPPLCLLFWSNSIPRCSSICFRRRSFAPSHANTTFVHHRFRFANDKFHVCTGR